MAAGRGWCSSGWLWQCSASTEKQRSETGDDVQGGRPSFETPGVQMMQTAAL